MNKEFLIDFLKYLESMSGNPEAMSSFRRCREPELEHYSYGKLLKWCKNGDEPINQNVKKTLFFIAWAFSIYRDEKYAYNVRLGKALKIIKNKISENTIDSLFNCICSSNDTDELIEYLEKAILLCESGGIKIDIVELGLNVFFWKYGNNEITKIKWAEDCYC